LENLKLNKCIKDNLKVIYARIAKACERAGRHHDEVTLLPITKTKSADDIRLAASAGLVRFGENKAQEAQSKAEATSDLPLRWCIVGHLQSNKVKHIARFASELHSLDNLKLAEELDRRLQKENRSIDALIQVNTSREEQKYGLLPENVLTFAKELPTFQSLRIRGLMTVAVFSPDKEEIRLCFARLRELREQLRQDSPGRFSWDALSMGMSGDFELAIEEGATEIRIGQAIFGTRASNL